MASPFISVFVKSLSGEILAVEVDPSLGLKGVADVLSHNDPDTFPPQRTHTFFADDTQTVLTSESVLGVMIDPRTHCTFVSKEEITLHGTPLTGFKTPTDVDYHHWVFRLVNGEDLHVYLCRLRLEWTPTVPRLYLSTSAWDCAHGPDKEFYTSLQHAFSHSTLTPQDTHIIRAVIHKRIPKGFRDITVSVNSNYKYFCECGCVITMNNRNKHFFTKYENNESPPCSRHRIGDEAGKKFLSDADVYLKSI